MPRMRKSAVTVGANRVAVSAAIPEQRGLGELAAA
jgi:hypothetical protein